MSSHALKFPAPYFGGKSAVAKLVWAALGQPKHYLEPFFGSGAVLLARPNWKPGIIETVNDADGFLCNVWRALQFSPDEVAKWCDWPVNHADLMARKAAIIKNEGRLLAGLTTDDQWHDPVMAGYWIWAASAWIGSGLTRPGQIPHVSDGGVGVHAPGQIPHVGTRGIGVQDPYNTNLYDWFRRLSERLRYVRVICGDWSRQESLTVAAEAREWALERGTRPTYRIVLAGYYEEHESLLSQGWSVKRWKAQGGYGHISRNGQQNNPGKINRHREALFFSPHCLNKGLFE